MAAAGGRFPSVGLPIKLQRSTRADRGAETVSRRPGTVRRQTRAIRRDPVWREFAHWCHTRGLRPLPAHPWTLAAYARWCESQHRPETIVERIRSIARVHVLACVPSPDRHPIVGRTLSQLRLREQTRPHRAALFEADLADGSGEQAPSAPASADEGGREAEHSTPRRSRSMRSTPRLVPRRPKRLER